MPNAITSLINPSPQMKNKNLLTLLIMFVAFELQAQTNKLIRVQNGQDATKHIAAKDRFKYDTFQTGKITYMNGTYAQARFNYCYLFGEVMYIDPKGDTLLLANNGLINYIDIGKVRYISDQTNGHLEILEDYSNIKLAKREIYKMRGSEKKGAYQNQNEQGSVTNSATFTDITGNVSTLPANNTILLKPTVFFYAIDSNRSFYKISRSSILKIFPRNKKEIEQYIHDQPINFNNEEDIRKIVKFSSQLKSE